jgi:hypothetical protein
MSSLRRHIGVLGQIAGFYLIHFLFFGRHFVDGSAILVGDSQIAISLNNLATYTLNTYHEFLWWDPTGLNGYPALVNLTHGWFNYLSPLILPGHVFVWIATSLLHWPLVTAVQVQLFSLAYLSSLIFVVLLSRELIRSPLARLFPPLVFTLGASANQFFMLAQHGPALAPTLAYLFGLIYFWRRRTPSSLFVFMVFLSCFVASINYIAFSSHLFPLVLFTILLVVFTPNSLFSAWTALRAAMGTVRGSVLVALGTVSCIVAFVNIGLTLHYFAAEIVRVGDNLKDFSFASEGLAALATPPNWGIAPQRIFLAFNQWFPFDDAYRFVLRDEPWQDLFIPRIDMRYIGIVTLPLLVSAVAFGRQTGLVAPLLATYFLCTFVLPYTYWLEPFQYLFDHVPILRNIRAMANTMPRDIPAVFAALLAGIGLDAFLGAGRRSLPVAGFVLAVAFGMALCAAILALDPAFLPMRHSLAHIAAYLGLSSLIMVPLLRWDKPAVRTRLVALLLLITFADLTVSSSYYWQRVAWTLPKQPTTLLPDPTRFGPIKREADNWFGNYSGHAHGSGPNYVFGLRSWLVLASRERWRPVLENWNPQTGRMTEYPALRFYSSATFVPFERITEIEHVPPPDPTTTFYIHDETALAGLSATARKLEANWVLTKFTPNSVHATIDMLEPGFVLHLDNFDRFWKARVNGTPADVYPANFTFKALKLPAGRSFVALEYDPYPIKWGWAAYYLSFIGLLAAGWIGSRGRLGRLRYRASVAR